jgi:hypothetical protein
MRTATAISKVRLNESVSPAQTELEKTLEGVEMRISRDMKRVHFGDLFSIPISPVSREATFKEVEKMIPEHIRKILKRHRITKIQPMLSTRSVAFYDSRFNKQISLPARVV